MPQMLHKKRPSRTAASQYIPRRRALRKLQISLSEFRRLCILKGIYPRDLTGKKKPNGNPNTTFYYAKDINFLAREPLLAKFRAIRVFNKRLTKAIRKRDKGIEQNLRENEPVVKVDHIVRERYPTFMDAVRDLDDCLCLVALYANMPYNKRVPLATTQKCKRLMDEFMLYVVHTRALRKVFLSIKGIYYQVDIMGQPVTWVAPYKFNTVVETNVDYRVMANYLLLYTTMLAFVNWKLYNMANLKYPPPVSTARDSGMGLSALIVQSADQDAATKAALAEKNTVTEQIAASGKRVQKALKALRDAASGKGNSDGDEEDAGQSADAAPAAPAEATAAAAIDEFPEQMEGGEETVPGMNALVEQEKAEQRFARLFENLHFFLGREVPRYSLEFVIRALGGNVSWEASDESEAGPYSSGDARITHHIVDRPKLQGEPLSGRHYIQPQWVYDSINAQILLPTASYAVGATLPPHLSPFASEDEGNYVPPERIEQLKMAAKLHSSDMQAEASGKEEGAPDEGTKEDAEEDQEDGEEEDDVAEDDEEMHRKELEAELRGESADLDLPTEKQLKKKHASAKRDAEEKAKFEERERVRLAKAVMPNKKKKLYNLITGKDKKRERVAQKMAERRKNYEQAVKSGGKDAPVQSTKRTKMKF